MLLSSLSMDASDCLASEAKQMKQIPTKASNQLLSNALRDYE
jgi:hypothetical protein